MKNMYLFYFFALLCSVNSLIFCSPNKINSTIQANKKKSITLIRSLEGVDQVQDSLDIIAALQKSQRDIASTKVEATANIPTNNLPDWVHEHESPTSITTKQFEQNKEIATTSHVFTQTQKTINDNDLQARKMTSQQKKDHLLTLSNLNL